jgi:transitional endoplasmic reticulum ATPase
MTNLVTSSQSRVAFDPSYNETGITESAELTASVEQYWQTRKTACKESIERLKPLAANREAEQKWQAFCAHRTGFLDYFARNGLKSSVDLLAELWERKIAQDANRALQSQLKVELCIPFQRSPLSFACTASRSGIYRVRESPISTGQEYFELGKAYVSIFLGTTGLFTIVPSGNYVLSNTFEFTKDGITWNSGEILPKAFSQALAEFQADLRDAERSFAPLHQLWNNKSSLAMKTDELARIDQSAEAWRRVQLPEAQKLEILRRMELFERGDPGAPRGLLLKGTSGNGKSLIARTIAETMNCDFQKLSLPDIKEEHLGASPKRVREIWNHAKSHLPAIIFVDDCDRVFGQRGAAETDVIAEDIVGAFLPQWDGVEQTHGIMVIGATNRPDTLDGAILSRFGWEMEILLPDGSSRLRIFQQELQAIGIGAELPVEFTSLTQGMSGRDLRNLASSAKSLAHPDKLTSDHILLAIAAARNKGTVEAELPDTWDTLAVESSVVDRLKLLSALLQDVEKWQAQGIRVPRSLLLIGPDAGIKRRIAHTLKYESGRTLLAPTVADLKANFSGQSGNRVKMIAERARSSSPSILLLERLEFIAPSRDKLNASDALTNEIVGQLTQEFDRFQDRLTHVFLVGATSNPDHIDAEVLRCFDERIVISVPDRSARVKLFTNLLAGKKLSFGLEDGAFLLAQLTEDKGLESDDLEAWVHSAEQKALLRAIKNGGPEHYMIELDDFDSPDTSNDEIESTP